MRYIYLTITDKDGKTEVVEFAIADEGKVLMDKDGNTVTSVERSRVDEFTEVDAALHEDLPPEEALAILLGEGGEGA